MQRNSPKMLAVRAVESGKLYAPFLLFYLITLRDTDGLFGTALDILFWVFTYSRLHVVFFDWWTTCFTLTDEALVFEKGLLVKERLAIAWSDMASVQVSEPLVQRALKCVSVQVGVGSQTKQQVVLDAVTIQLAEEIQRRHTTTGPQPEEPTPANKSVGMDGMSKPVAMATMGGRDATLYSIRPLDYALIATTYGQVFLIFPVLLSLYADISTWLPLPSVGWLSNFFDSATWWRMTLLLLFTFVVAFGYGCLIAWLRYRSFKVERREDTFYISGGLATREIRQIEQADVVGLKLEQNPVMRATGYARLSLVSREAGSKMKANVIFPAVRLDWVMSTISDAFPTHGSGLKDPIEPNGPHGLVFLISCAVTGGSWAVITWIRPDDSPLVGIVLSFLLLIWVNRLWAAVALHGDALIQYRRGFLWVKQYALPAGSVHVAACSQGPAGRTLGVANLTLVVHDARPVRLRVIGYSSAPTYEVMQRVLAQSIRYGEGDERNPGLSAPVAMR